MAIQRSKHKFVWPRDTHKGRGPQGLLQRLRDVLTNRGPDVFIQPMDSLAPITVDEWSNWDSYHLKEYDSIEDNPYFPKFCRRGTERYDPEKRKYVTWGKVPRWDEQAFNSRDLRRNARDYRQKKKTLRSCNTASQLKSSETDYDWFWNAAHRTGMNIRHGRHPYDRTPIFDYPTGPWSSIEFDTSGQNGHWRDYFPASHPTRSARSGLRPDYPPTEYLSNPRARF